MDITFNSSSSLVIDSLFKVGLFRAFASAIKLENVLTSPHRFRKLSFLVPRYLFYLAILPPGFLTSIIKHISHSIKIESVFSKSTSFVEAHNFNSSSFNDFIGRNTKNVLSAQPDS